MKMLPLAMAVAVSSFTSAVYAEVNPAEVEQLRNEVAQLKALAAQQLSKNQATQTTAQAPAVKTKSGADVKVYGFVRADAVYKLKGTNGQVFNDLAYAAEGNNDIKLETTLNTTRLGFEFNTPVTGSEQTVGGKIEGDFNGNGAGGSPSLRVRHAYLTYGNWLVGQTWSTFSELDTLAEIIDDNLIAGQGATRVPMVRYEKAVAPATTVAVALERNANAEQAPNLVGRVQQKFADDKGLVSVRGFVGQASVAENNIKDDAVAWGTAVGVSYQVNDNIRVMGDYYHIKGNDVYLEQDNAYASLNQAGKEIALSEVDVIGGGVNYVINPKVDGSIGAGYIRAKDNAFAKANTTANEKVVQGYANIVYKPVEPVRLGVEYVQGEATTFEGKKSQDQRVGLSAVYNF